MDIEYDISLCLDTPMGLEELRAFIAAVEAHSEPAAYEVLAQPADFRPESPAGCRVGRLLLKKWGRRR